VLSSAILSKAFYEQLGKHGLSARMKQKWTNQTVSKLDGLLPKNAKILDLGCGYGRLTIPLAEKGYQIEGIDLSAPLIKSAKKEARKRHVKVKFRTGNMCHLPYNQNRFDVVICMWSAFSELLGENEQLLVIKSVHKILTKNGWALFEMGLYQKPNAEEIRTGKFYGFANRIRKGLIGGIRNDHYNHNKKTLTKLLQRAKIRKYAVKIDDWAGRPRLTFQFRKNKRG
jgi:ubiquinone/menaquinone biosynthesis C-methylase UbiE